MIATSFALIVFALMWASARIAYAFRLAPLWHGAVATTRQNAIYLRGSGAQFAADAALMLHEYFHVLRQWNAGALTVAGYVGECIRRGYARNRFEVEARAFAAAHATRLTELLRQGAGASAPAAHGHALRDFSAVSRP